MKLMLLTLSVLAGIALTACSAEATPAPPTPEAAVAPAAEPQPATTTPAPSKIVGLDQLTDVCALLDAELVAKSFGGKPVTGVAQPSQVLENGGNAALCNFVVDGEPAASLAVTTFPGNQITPEQMIAAVQGAGGEPAPEVGPATLFAEKGGAAVLNSAHTVGGTPVLVSLSGPKTVAKSEFSSVLTPLTARF